MQSHIYYICILPSLATPKHSRKKGKLQRSPKQSSLSGECPDKVHSQIPASDEHVKLRFPRHELISPHSSENLNSASILTFGGIDSFIHQLRNLCNGTLPVAVDTDINSLVLKAKVES